MISKWIRMRLGLNGNQLKLIAVVSMLIDHIGLELIGRGMLLQIPVETAVYQRWYLAYLVMRTIGRMAFPIYGYLLVEGYTYTRSWKKYAVRLGIFAMLSEIPFDLLAAGQVVSWQQQNVFFTLLAGLLMMKVLDTVRRSELMVVKPEAETFLQFFVIGITCVLALVVKSDYDYIGVLLIVVFYWFRGMPEKQCLAGFVWCAWAFQKWYFICGYLAAFVMLYFYNGKRGNDRWRYGYYLFYPVHMLVLACVLKLWYGIG